jgi:acyl-CoA dehydrogenase
MISFEPSEEQRMIQDMARDFAANELRPLSHECDEKAEIPESVLQGAWELGMVNATIPEDLGGVGMDRSAVTGSLMCEELAYGDLSMAMAILAPGLFGNPIMDFGTQGQKETYLKKLTEGTFQKVTAAVVEPVMDFDLAALNCSAKENGSGYVLNGKKCFVPLGTKAERYMVYAALNKPGYENVSGFVVDKGASGLTVSERERNMGIKALDTAELTLENVKVPAEARLGGDEGCDFAKLMNFSRVALSSMAVGMARASYDYAREYAKERVAFGEPIAFRQAIAFMIAEMAIEVDSARCLVWEAAWKLDKAEDALKECYLAKLYADQMVMRVCDCGVQILGGHGYIREHPVERWFRNARGFSTFEGMATV